MKKTKKIIGLVAVAAMLVGASILGTMAYLTSQDTVTNTFTVGKVEITLDETDVDTAGVKDGETRVKENDYKIVPGHTYVKDPTVHVSADSEDAWLFVKVVDEIASIEDTKTVAAQMTENGWTAVQGETNVFAYRTTVSKNTDVKVFDNFKIKGTETAETLAAFEGKKIEVTAYAVQKDGFATAKAAWDATFKS